MTTAAVGQVSETQRTAANFTLPVRHCTEGLGQLEMEKAHGRTTKYNKERGGR